MRQKNKEKSLFRKEKRIDLIFCAIALIFLIVMILLLGKYNDLKTQNESVTDGYSAVTQTLIDTREEKTALEIQVEAITRELNELKSKIDALSGK